MKVFVIGGSGFIGTKLVELLIDSGHQVIIYDKRRSDEYPDLCVIGDVRDREKLTAAMKDIDFVYHLAAEHKDDVRPITLYDDVNVGGAKNIVYALSKHAIKKLVFTSTVAIYGLNRKEPDENCVAMPFNEYGKSKYKSELIFSEWAAETSKSTLVIVRPTVVFGENNRGNVYNLLLQIVSNKFIMIGDGYNKKSLAYVLNVACFLVSMMEHDLGVHIYNYADKPDLSMNELIETVYTIIGKEGKLKLHIPYQIGLLFGYLSDFISFILKKNLQISSIRIRKFCADTVVNSDKLEQINFVSRVGIKEGLRRTIENEFMMKKY